MCLYCAGTPVSDFSCKLLIMRKLRHSERLGPGCLAENARMSN